MPTVADVLYRASSAVERLVSVAEAVEDEWQYVTDLESAWSARFAEVLATRGPEPVAEAVLAAVDRAAEESAAISDPHRAIDWLSTLPQIALFALDEAT